jgi:hypothetical protein
LALLQQERGELLDGGGDHPPAVSQIEALAERAREIQGFGDDHPVFPPRQIKGHMVA